MSLILSNILDIKKMKKNFIVILAAATAQCALAAVPVKEEAPAVQTASKARLVKQSARVAAQAAADSEQENQTFFEGFEGRPSGYGTYYDEWLPEGWQDVSKSGQTVPAEGDYRHNLTWRVLSNDDRNNAPMCMNYAYEGENFAYIMSDVAYDGHHDLAVQDEWLISPEFTPVAEDWLHFRLFHNAAWATYNRTANDFTARNNELEVQVSTDGGETWTKLWNEIDDAITGKYTEAELRSILIDINRYEYDHIFVDLKDYVGKPVKVAFRFMGSTGHGVSIDNVSVGIPMPVAKYDMPAGFFKQGVSPYIEYPVERHVLMPFNREATWINSSASSLSYEWTFDDAAGVASTSAEKDLVTPAYPMGSLVSTPTLTALFESRRSEPYSLAFSKMQAGGSLHGRDSEGYEGEFGVGYYDIGDPNHKVVVSSGFIGFAPNLDLNWEMRLGQPDGALDIEGFANYYPAAGVPYGFDYVDIPAIVNNIEDDTKAQVMVFNLDAEGNPADLIGYAELMGSQVEYTPGEIVNLHFRFDVPVYAEKDVLVLFGGFNRELDDIALLYLKTTSENLGNSMMYLWAVDMVEGGWYETFYNLNNFPLADGYHFAGLMMTLGASYSEMELKSGDRLIEAPLEGCTRSYTLTGTHKAERWALTENGALRPDWVDYEFTQNGDEVNLTLTVLKNENTDARQTQLHIVSPGSRVTLDVTQPGDESSITDVEAAQAVTVGLEGENIRIGGTDATAEVYNAAGVRVAAGKGLIPAGHLAKGVYLVRVSGKTVKILK